MMSRHNDEERARKDRLMLERELNEQKKLEEQLRQARHRQKQATLYEDFKARDARQVNVQARLLFFILYASVLHVVV